MKTMKKRIAKSILWLFRWRLETHVLPEKKAIIMGYPHTSAWDFPLSILTFWALELDVKWMGKQSLFQGRMAPLFRALGGLAVDRSGGKNTVQSVAELFQEHETLLIGITPSGTRSRSPHLRSGFYHMAHKAGVPLLLASMDFKKRRATLLESIHLSGNVTADMDRIREIYGEVRGKNPEQQTPVRLAEEVEGNPEPPAAIETGESTHSLND
jgi:hypothetical protein